LLFIYIINIKSEILINWNQIFADNTNNINWCINITNYEVSEQELRNKSCLFIDGDYTDNLQEAINVAIQYKKVLYLKGDFVINKPIVINGSITIIWHPEFKHPKIITNSKQSPFESILVIEKNVKNVILTKISIQDKNKTDISELELKWNNENIYLNRLRFYSNNKNESKRITGVFINWQNNKEIYIRQSYFINLGFGIRSVGSLQNIYISSNNFRGFSQYALFIWRSKYYLNGKIKNIFISKNYFHDPEIGPTRGVIAIYQSDSISYITNVNITSNIIEGPYKPWVPENKNKDNATTDQIILHWVNIFRIVNNEVFWGGENWITVSRLTRNGIIAKNKIYWNDWNGLSIGSGYYEAFFKGDKNIEIKNGMKVIWEKSKAKATITNIHYENNKLKIWLDRVKGWKIFRDENLLLEETNEKIWKIYNIDRTKKIKIYNNDIYNNGLDANNDTPYTYWIFIVNVDTIDVYNNNIYNLDYDNKTQVKSIAIYNSRNIKIYDTNIFEKWRETVKQAIIKSRSSRLRK
jgi:hypothetical protein